MSAELDIRRLLKIRADLEEHVEQLNMEIENVKIAMAEIDKTIVKYGFRQPVALHIMKPTEIQIEPQISSEMKNAELSHEGSSIQAKDGTILGKVQIIDNTITFTPKEELNFTISTPPFQSFLMDRVLTNMKTTDEARATTGEITPEQVLSFNIEVEGETIKKITIRNFGGERRLREIQSSLRWSLDKMYDKIRRG